MIWKLCCVVVFVAILTSPCSDCFAAAGQGGHIGAEGASKDPSEFKTDLAIYTFVMFLLLLCILWKFAWGPLVEGLDKRESGVRQNIADAEAARVKAEEMLAEHQEKLNAVQNEVKEILASARRDAEQAGQRIVAEAQTQADANKERAIADIEQAKDQALQELFGAMAGQVATATEYVLGHGMTAGDQDRLIQEALAELGNGGK